jgi:glutamate synthase domain-containing protein 1
MSNKVSIIQNTDMIIVVAGSAAWKEYQMILFTKRYKFWKLEHRGAASADITGDSAGILLDIPYDFFKNVFLQNPKTRILVSNVFFFKRKISASIVSALLKTD